MTAELKNNTAEKKPKTKLLGGDKHLWGIYIALCLISVIELYSASSREVADSAIGVYGPIVRHALMLVAGFVVVVLLQRVHYKKFAPIIPIFAIFSLALMILVLVKGDTSNGAARSITIGVPIQPSEFIKITAVSIIALVLAMTQNTENMKIRTRGVVFVVVVVSIFALLLIRDGFTNTMILMAISLAMMLIGGIRIPHFLLVIVLYAGAVAGHHFYSQARYEADVASGNVNRSEIHEKRVASFNDTIKPVDQPVTTDNMQAQYSFMAQANGGMLGVFPGNSRETARLPLAFSDYIYAIIIEDMGLVGGLVVLVLFLWLLARALGIASRCRAYFPMLLVIGMAVFIVTQALTHMAIVTGVVPVSGQPLPLISKGGTSILTTSIAFGVMLSVSRYAVRTGKKKDIKAEKDALPAELRGDNPSLLADD